MAGTWREQHVSFSVVAMVKLSDQLHLSFLLHFPVTVHFFRHSGEELEVEPMEKHSCLACLFFSSPLTTFLIKPKVTHLGMVPPTVGWALPHQGAIKTILIAVSTGQYDPNNSSMEAGVRWLQTVSSWQLKLPRTNGCQTIMEESIGLKWGWRYCISVAKIQSHSIAKRRLCYQKVSMFCTLKSVSPLCL